MILGAIVTAFLASLDALLSLLPSWTVPTWPDSAWIGIAVELDAVFPVGVLIWSLFLTLAAVALLQLWDFGVWIFHQFWGSS